MSTSQPLLLPFYLPLLLPLSPSAEVPITRDEGGALCFSFGRLPFVVRHIFHILTSHLTIAMNSFLKSLSSETQLMIALCRLSFGNEDKDYIYDLVRKVTGWNHFVSLANEHGISALVCNNLKELKLIDRLPVQEARFLENTYLKSLSRNTYLFEKLEEVKKHLAEINIEPVLLKGMALELTAYGNMGLRQMNDIDLFVEREDCLKAWNHLIGKSYQPQALKSPLYKKIILDIGKHLPELYSDGISIELHHKLFDTPPSSGALAKEDRTPNPVPRTYEINIDGLSYSLLRLDIHFLFLIKHLVYHETEKGESQLRLYNDLCQLMTQCTMDIKSAGIIELASQLGLLEVLFEKFYILHLLWDMPLPDELFKSLSDNQKQEAENKLLKFLKQPKGNKVRNRGKIYRETIRQIPGFRKKFYYIIGDLFPSISFMKTRYHLKSTIIVLFVYLLRLPKLILLILP